MSEKIRKFENSFSERLDKEINRLKKSYNQVESELGYSRNALHNYKHTRQPSGQRLIELSNYFGVTPEYLMGAHENRKVKSVKNVFHELNSEERIEMLLLCKDWLNIEI